MPKNHEKFHSANGKRLILIADDEMINRELLANMLEADYELITAANGREAYDLIDRNRDMLSLVLLDLLMPEMHGLDLLKKLKEDPVLSQIPVIVMTADKEAEVDSLNLGAIDFIPKPFPEQKVILARVLRTIELSEDRQIIQSTERDPLTGLYNREFFYGYAQQYDQHHKDKVMDAIVVDINHFHIINERYGKAYGDEVLRKIGEQIREKVQDSGGIVCRREADTFLVYCPHREDYKEILDYASSGLGGNDRISNRVRLRMGVYSEVDKNIDVERRFDRAKLAADTVKGSFSRPIAIYDEALHESEIYVEQLLEDFHEAIDQHQFLVYYQPKFDIRPEIPVLSSAEALVRWCHPRLGMINPGVFIPLFEDNGMIQELDRYVWREAARQISDWVQRFGVRIPVSVNVSRVDMYDPNLIDYLVSLLEEYHLGARDLLLEITESAYTQDSEQIIEIVNRLRAIGFHIEMDDFGTGYSSLNMISRLPIDALKLDMQFIRNAFKEGKDTRIIEVIIDIAGYLSVPVIAEGVET
ncbi:MAG: EAL domain-containing protein, partial [Parasporobacterium sp.]|nr:EAL domain-containing protein [Parasporobacterium sp.]